MEYLPFSKLEFLMATCLSSVQVGNKSIPFIFEESHQLPIVHIDLVFQNSGSIFDGDLPGLVHLVSKLLNEGSRKSGIDKFVQKLDSNAIKLFAINGYESFSISITTLKEKLPQGIELLKELLEYPNLDKKVLEKVKNRTLSSILKFSDDFDYQASKNLQKLIFNLPPIFGESETIRKIELAHIEKYIRNYLIVENVVPVIGGDVGEDEAKEILQSLIAVLPNGKSRELPKLEFAPKKDRIIEYRDTKQSYIYFASPFNLQYSDEDIYKAKVMFFILGSSGFGSRLMEEVRVKHGLAYSVSGNRHISKTRSYFSGHLQTSIENQDRAIELVENVIGEFIKKGATAEELKSAKDFILGSEPLRNETLPQRLGQAFNNYYYGHSINHHKETLEKIAKLKLSDLNRFIKSHKEILELRYSIITQKGK